MPPASVQLLVCLGTRRTGAGAARRSPSSAPLSRPTTSQPPPACARRRGRLHVTCPTSSARRWRGRPSPVHGPGGSGQGPGRGLGGEVSRRGARRRRQRRRDERGPPCVATLLARAAAVPRRRAPRRGRRTASSFGSGSPTTAGRAQLTARAQRSASVEIIELFLHAADRAAPVSLVLFRSAPERLDGSTGRLFRRRAAWSISQRRRARGRRRLRRAVLPGRRARLGPVFEAWSGDLRGAPGRLFPAPPPPFLANSRPTPPSSYLLITRH